MGQSSGDVLNPLDLPWAKPPPPEPEGESVPHFIGVRNEVVRDDAGAKEIITIEVRAVSGVPSGKYTLEYTPGQRLSKYLSRLKLKRAATYNAVYDQSNLEKGRCRMSYVPEVGAHITIGPPAYGSAMQYQRSSMDSHELGRRLSKGPRVVDIDLTYKEPT